MSADQDIRDLLRTYESALNAGDAALAAACYTADGVFMPTTLPTVSGAAMERGYAALFAAIRLDVVFDVDELVVANESVAYALTRSNGTQTVLAGGGQTPESNREVFIFGVEEGAWKIARYLFNKPN
jgi:uncharacterized protein (TIGR02246 family)